MITRKLQKKTTTEILNTLFPDNSITVCAFGRTAEHSNKPKPYTFLKKGDPIRFIKTLATSLQKSNVETAEDLIHNPFPLGTESAHTPAYTYISVPEELPQEPEINKEDVLKSDVEPENRIDVPDDVIIDFENNREKSNNLIRDVLLNKGVATMMAFDESSGYVEAVMRDVYNMDIEISSMTEVLSSLMKLKMVDSVIHSLGLSDQLKTAFLTKLGEEAATSVQSHSRDIVKDRYSAILNHLSADKKPKTSQIVSDKPDNSSVGVVRGRSSHVTMSPSE